MAEFIYTRDNLRNLVQLSSLINSSLETQEALNNALMSITRDPLPCEYQIPTPSNPLEGISYDKIQVVHTPASGPPEEVPYATTRGGCSAAYGGWYYDTPPNLGTPSQIIMCPCTCASFGAGTVDMYVGCPPRIIGLQ